MQDMKVFMILLVFQILVRRIFISYNHLILHRKNNNYVVVEMSKIERYMKNDW